MEFFFKHFSKNYLRQVLFFVIFVIFLIPFSVEINEQGVSANYLYALFPLLILFKKEMFNPPKLHISAFLIFCAGVFVITSIYQDEFVDIFIRRSASFMVFMSLFSLIFIKIDSDMIVSFKYALIFISVYSTLTILIEYFSLGGSELGTYAKGLVGSQRIGFVYVVALWIVFFYNSRTVLLTTLKFSFSALITIGLLLTFSRTSIFALLGSLAVFFIVFIFGHIRDNKNFSFIFGRLTLIITSMILFVIMLQIALPNVMGYYKQSIFGYMTETTLESSQNLLVSEALNWEQEIDSPYIKKYKDQTKSLVLEHIKDKETSIGYRYYMSKKVINFVSQHPLTGSGFLGVWIMMDNKEGSAHSQYLDILFRIGIIGFFVFIFFICRIACYLYLRDPGLFVGFIGILLYGVFHETFKLSQGGFIFAFLIAIYEQHKHFSVKLSNSP